MYVRHTQSVPVEPVSTGSHISRQILIGSQQGPNFALRKFTIEPGGAMPLHTNRVEHEQYILRGRAHVMIGEESLVVGQDDVVFIPAGVPHSYRTLGNEAFEFLCAVPNLPDETVLVEVESDQAELSMEDTTPD